MQSVTLDEGVTSYTLPACTFTPPTDLVFSHWENNGVYEGMAGETITLDADTELTAVYGVGDTLFSISPGTGNGDPIEHLVVTGQEYIIPTPEQANFTPPSAGLPFVGWIPDSEGEQMVIDGIVQPGTTFTIEADTAIMAFWAGDGLDLWLEKKNGTGEDVTIPYYKGSNPSITFQLPTAGELGWDAPESYVDPILVWYSDAQCTERVGDPGDEITLTTDTTLYGQWSET